jgi:ApaG protein
MSTAITSGIQVSARAFFKEEISRVQESYYYYGYTIEIENITKNRVQLLSRRWEIFDSLSAPRIVEGEGVIGEQPIFEPGECFSYSSSCDLFSEIGSMQGIFIFIDLSTKIKFEVTIPRFVLHYFGKLN